MAPNHYIVEVNKYIEFCTNNFHWECAKSNNMTVYEYSF